MNEESGTPAAEKRSGIAAGIVRRADTIAISIVVQAVLLFLTAGRLTWTWAWVYVGICLVSIVISGVIMFRTNRETVEERSQPLPGDCRAAGAPHIIAVPAAAAARHGNVDTTQYCGRTDQNSGDALRRVTNRSPAWIHTSASCAPKPRRWKSVSLSSKQLTIARR